MAARDMSQWETQISEIRSNEREEEIEVRGRSLSDLVGHASFAEMTTSFWCPATSAPSGCAGNCSARWARTIA